MYSSRSAFPGLPKRYSANKTVKPVNFICLAPGARHVSLVGDFNDWHPNANPMKRQPDGAWMIQVMLGHGPHHYLFCVDGNLLLDPRAQGAVRSKEHGKISLITVS